ncbi:MAG TPA: DinB family protein, partial [Pyrinomonadaceae bacterium]|nr:DinB family protein [Pyrinomonadaceae bacterium]
MQALAVLVENEISHRGANVRESGKVPSGFYAEYDDEGIQGRIELTINLSGHNTLDLRATLNETSSTQKQAVIENRLPFHKPSGNYHLVRFSPEDSRATTDEFIEKGRRTIKESAESLGHKMAVNHSMRNDTLQALLQSIEYAEVFVWTPLSSDHKQRLRALTGQEIVVPAEYDQYNKIYFLNDAALRMYRDLGETFEVWKMISPDEMAVIPGPSLRGPYLSKSAEGKQLTTMNFKLEDAKVILRNTPATLHSLLENLPQEWVVTNEGPDTWSPFDILGHLIHGEETDWIPRARMILGHGEARAFEPFDRFAMFEKSKGKSLTDLLAEFTRLREANLQELERLNLTPELLEKRGKHPE